MFKNVGEMWNLSIWKKCGRIHMNLVTLFTSEGGVGMDKKIYFSIRCTV